MTRASFAATTMKFGRIVASCGRDTREIRAMTHAGNERRPGYPRATPGHGETCNRDLRDRRGDRRDRELRLSGISAATATATSRAEQLKRSRRRGNYAFQGLASPSAAAASLSSRQHSSLT
jgi:hypothetical protein